MTLLTILTSTSADGAEACLSFAGFVDRQTAAAEEVVLWSDRETLNDVEAATAIDRVPARMA